MIARAEAITYLISILKIRREQSFPALQFEILKCDLRIETKLNNIPGSVFCRYLGQF